MNIMPTYNFVAKSRLINFMKNYTSAYSSSANDFKLLNFFCTCSLVFVGPAAFTATTAFLQASSFLAAVRAPKWKAPTKELLK